jgi:hypothetical protein
MAGSISGGRESASRIVRGLDVVVDMTFLVSGLASGHPLTDEPKLEPMKYF